MTHTPGFFISFEGPDGGGKTTQIERLRVRLADRGFNVIKTREIGGTPEAEKIRNLIVPRSGGDWLPLSTMMMISVARYEHTERVIQPAVRAGQIVLSDRYADSTYVYQVVCGGNDVANYQTLNGLTLGGYQPDLTIILDVDPTTSISRARASVQVNVSAAEKADDRFEGQGSELQQRVRAGYLAIAAAHPYRCVVVDATQSVDKVTEDVWAIVEQRMIQRG